MKQSHELKELVLQSHEAIMNADYAFFSQLFSQRDGVLVIGTDPDEWLADYATIIKVFEAQFEEPGGVTIVDAAPEAYSEGTVGWVADRSTFRLSDGAELPLRLTAVFHQEENGAWKAVQWHVSIGVSSE